MRKKPQKVNDPSHPSAAKKAAKAEAKTATADAEFRRISGKLLSERKELLRKLAQ